MFEDQDKHLKSLRHKFEFFADRIPQQLPPVLVVSSRDVPPPFYELLVHEQHMTVTLERFFGLPVAVRVLARYQQGTDYARLIRLVLEGTDQIVEYGVFHMDLSICTAKVQAQILEEKAPLGRILIKNDVLRSIEPVAYLKFPPSRQIGSWFETDSPNPCYGRLARILCNGAEAIELLEVVRPDPMQCKAAVRS